MPNSASIIPEMPQVAVAIQGSPHRTRAYCRSIASRAKPLAMPYELK